MGLTNEEYRAITEYRNKAFVAGMDSAIRGEPKEPQGKPFPISWIGGYEWAEQAGIAGLGEPLQKAKH